MFGIDISNNIYKSSSATNSDKGCLFIDVKKMDNKAILAKLEMTFQDENKGLIFGTVLVNSTEKFDQDNTQYITFIRQKNWSLRLEKQDNNWSVKEGWMWGSSISGYSNQARNLKITFKVEGDVSATKEVDLKDLCYMDHEDCLKIGKEMQQVLLKKYKWQDYSTGKEPFEMVTVTPNTGVIAYWKGQKLSQEKSNVGNLLDGYIYQSECESTRKEWQSDNSQIKGVFYDQKFDNKTTPVWSPTNADSSQSDKDPIVLTQCIFDIYVKKDDSKLKTIKGKWVSS